MMLEPSRGYWTYLDSWLIIFILVFLAFHTAVSFDPEDLTIDLNRCNSITENHLGYDQCGMCSIGSSEGNQSLQPLYST